MGLQLQEQSIVGYAFQQRFIELAQACVIGSNPLHVTFGSTVEDWVISQVFTQDPFLRLEDQADLAGGLFFWCVGNTTAYDAILILPNGRIRFIQVTAGKEHTFPLDAVVNFLKQLEKRNIEFTHVDFVVVRPADDDQPFSLVKRVGSLHNWRDLSGAVWDKGDNCRHNNVRYGTLHWSAP
jgi:hypothetical protein